MPELEAQLLGRIAGGGYEGPGPSPDRADAMVGGERGDAGGGGATGAGDVRAATGPVADRPLMGRNPRIADVSSFNLLRTRWPRLLRSAVSNVRGDWRLER